MRVVVVGGGVVGLLAAVEATREGHQVTLVEQGDLPNPRASSSDEQRIMRALHPGDEATTAAAARAGERWGELERLVGTRCLVRNGALTVVPGERLDGIASALEGLPVRVRVLPPAALASSYPQVAFPRGAAGVLEPDAGVLLARRVLDACVRWLRAQPGTALHARRTVVEVDGDGGAVRLDGGPVLRADAVIAAPGPWARRLLPAGAGGGLTLHRQTQLYCRVPASRLGAWARMPAMPALGARGAWLVPPVAGTALKLSAASACREAGALAGVATPRRWREHLVAVFAGLLDGFEAGWVRAARDCYYLSHAPTGGPLTYTLGQRALCYAACGGGSFKLAPVIARRLVARVTGRAGEPARPYAQGATR